ncbi:MAG: hypothetical protein KDD52_01830 [Bdellovibrionales bacterium]|nr:hypothetical protein [Bdellovibrionales bacterium]
MRDSRVYRATSFTKRNAAFSLIESLIATVGFLAVVAVAYQVINKQQQTQFSQLSFSRIDRQMDVAMDRFKKDVSLIDSSWSALGVASIYPHQGLGFSTNYYIDPSISDQGLNDGVTFLKKSENAKIYAVGEKLYYPASNSAAGDKLLHGAEFLVSDGDANLSVGQWVMVYQPGSFALGVISNISGGGTLITLRALNTSEAQGLSINTGSYSTGHVIDAGAVPASFDYTGTGTTSTADDQFVFDPTNARLQVVEAVSYEIDWQTSDGLPKTGGNSYVLDAQGNPGKVLVRSRYHSGGVDREYLAIVDELWFTYDLMVSTTASGVSTLNGFLEGDVEFNVGRRNDGLQLLDLNLTDPSTAQNQFQSSGNIVGVKMSLVSKRLNSKGEEVALNRTMKISLDPSLQGEARFQEDDKVVASVTDFAETDPLGSGVRDTIGRPGYLRTGSSHEILVPVTKFDLSNPSQNDGKVLVYDDTGCPVNAGVGCTITAASYIQFQEPNGNDFFPNSVHVVDLYGGARRIIVGGMAVEFDHTQRPPVVLNRYASIATIDVPANNTITDMMGSSIPSGSTCSAVGCNLYTMQGVMTPDFKDTGGGISTYVDPTTFTDVSYIASLTKTSSSGRSKIYKTNYNDVAGSYSDPSLLVELDHTNRLITALGDRPFNVNGTNYLAVCTSRFIDPNFSIGSGSYPEVTPGQEGYIVMYPLDPSTGNVTSATGTIVATHNYRCGGVVNLDGNMVIAGRLLNQTISQTELENIVSGAGSAPMLYLDEIAGQDSGGGNKYADAFFVDPTSYSSEGLNQAGQGQRVSWLSGVSGVKLDDGKYNLVASNNFRVTPDGGSTLLDYQDAGIFQLTTAGMTEKVFASIQTDFSNLNASDVSASLILSEGDQIPSVFPAGQFYTAPSTESSPRGPTSLPSMPPAISEQGWIELYNEMMSQQSEDGSDNAIPAIDENWVPMNCVNTVPPTC